MAGLVAIILIIALVIAWGLFFPRQALRLGLWGSRKTAGMGKKIRDFGGGALVAYLEGGEGETIVMLHGFGADKDIFLPFVKALRGDYRIVIPDLFGFGESQLPGAWMPEEELERLHVVLRDAGVKSAHVIGNSMGGQLALLYAARYPEMVKSLCLVSPSGVWDAPQSGLIETVRRGGPNPLVVRSTEAFAQSMALGMVQPPKLPKALLRILAEPRIAQADKEEALFAELLAHPVEALLGGIKVPVLILFGEEDCIILPETARYLQQRFSDARMEIIPDAAHVAMYEAPQECAKYVEPFIVP